MAFSASLPSPLRMRGIGDEKRISTVNGMLSLVTVTVSELNSLCPWTRLSRVICKSISHAAYTSGVTKHECMGVREERCLPEFHWVEENQAGMAEFWEICKETASVGEAVAIIEADETKRSKLYGLLVAQAAEELRSAAMCLEAEYVMPETNDKPEQPSMVCETCGRNLQRSRQCWECGRLQCKHCAYWCTHCPSGSDKYTICSYCFLLGIYLRKKGKIWTCRRCRVLSETECDRDMRHACKKQVRGHGKGNVKRFFGRRRRHRKGKRR